MNHGLEMTYELFKITKKIVISLHNILLKKIHNITLSKIGNSLSNLITKFLKENAACLVNKNS